MQIIIALVHCSKQLVKILKKYILTYTYLDGDINSQFAVFDIFNFGNSGLFI